MTEGIIQQVFKNYLDKLDNMPWDKKDLLDLEQTLIEAIRNYNFDSDKYFDDTIKQQLTGDNQK